MTAHPVRSKSQRRRTSVALIIVLAVMVGFVVRLVDIQVVNAGEHIQQSQELIFEQTRQTYAARGEIVDALGHPLARSVLEYDAAIDPQNMYKDSNGDQIEMDWEQASAEIARITQQTPEQVRNAVADELAADPGDRYVRIAERLDTQKYRELAQLQLHFLSFQPHPARTYPDGAVAGNLIGFVNGSGQPVAGLEVSQQECLEATNGSVKYDQGGNGEVIPGSERVDKAAVDGGTVQLTIDVDLQWYLDQLIAEQVQATGAKSGTISVVEVKTGKIRAMSEYPTVDPNHLDGTDPANWYSRIFRNSFEPGSTFKAITASTLIEAGGQTPLSTVTVSDNETFANGARVRDAHRHGPLNYTLAGVLIDSSNAGISRFSERVSAQTRYDYLTKFGISTGSAIDYPEQANGFVRPADQWDNQTLYNTAYGQGLTTTIPELLGAYEAIANDGVRLPLQLVESCTAKDGTVTSPSRPDSVQVLSESTAVQVQQMLENVAMHGSYADKVSIPGYRVAVKSGTAEQVDPQTRSYRAGLYFTTMIGFAPADDPEFLVAVTFDQPRTETSSSANAPAFQMAMTQVLKSFRVLPATTPTTELPKFG